MLNNQWLRLFTRILFDGLDPSSGSSMTLRGPVNAKASAAPLHGVVSCARFPSCRLP